ncbi:chemotaxis protein CheB [bacterium]|nr:chemotaxis protein CheB [bacterium]
MIRILIVDDSVVVRRTLREIFMDDDNIEVVAEAQNGNEAVYFAKKFIPDVITMDIHMPGGNGFMAIEKIMRDNPTPILILTASAGISDEVSIFQVLKYGIVDIFEKPDIMEWEKNPTLKKKFFEKLHELSFLKDRMKKVKRERKYIASEIKLLAIISSTGGPKVLKDIFSSLKPELRVPILCVQHISRGFGSGLIKWMDAFSVLPVSTVANNEKLKKGHIYFPPDDHHLEISHNLRAVLNQKEPIFGLRPAGDYLLRSMSFLGDRGMGIILTGMGSDGSKGLREIYMNGGYTIVQDKESSVVWGMPKSAVELGCVNEVLGVSEMVDRINELI